MEPLLAALSDTDAALERTRLFGSAISPGVAETVLGLEAARAPEPVAERWLEYRLEGDFTLGATDAPHIRARAPLVWDPAAGPAVIAGGPRSGRTTALASVAAIAVELGMTPVWVPRDPRLAVRTLARAVEAERVVLLLDDCAHTLAAATTADPEAVDLLAAALLRLPAALVVPVSWSSHRLVAGASHRSAPHAASACSPAAGPQRRHRWAAAPSR